MILYGSFVVIWGNFWFFCRYCRVFLKQYPSNFVSILYCICEVIFMTILTNVLIFKAIFSFFGRYYIATLINFGNFEGAFARDIIECLWGRFVLFLAEVIQYYWINFLRVSWTILYCISEVIFDFFVRYIVSLKPIFRFFGRHYVVILRYLWAFFVNIIPSLRPKIGFFVKFWSIYLPSSI